jgi:hypothetical protein
MVGAEERWENHEFKSRPATGEAAGRREDFGTPGGVVRHHRLDYGAGSMMYRVDLVVRANVDDEALHEVLIRANTYAIVEAVEATRDSGGDDCLVTARINAPGPIAALGSLLTVLSQTSEFPGLAEEVSLRRVTVEREEPLAAS